MLKLCAIPLLFFTLMMVSILIYGFHDVYTTCDLGVILGSKANLDGTPSPRLAARLNKGIELYRAGIIKMILVSGGTGKEGVDEASVMKAYLVAHSVPSNAIMVDSEGYRTSATAKNTYAIMQAHHLKSALIISQYFHLARTVFAFKQLGIMVVGRAHANYYELRDLYSLVRETVGLCSYFVKSVIPLH